MRSSRSPDCGAVATESRLTLRLAARSLNAALLRAHLRLWLSRHGISESETRAILARATAAFVAALAVGETLRPLMVDIDINRTDNQVDVSIDVSTATSIPPVVTRGIRH